MENAAHALLNWLHLPEVGLTSLAVVSFLSATLLPMGSEALLLALVSWEPSQAVAAVGVATVFNTLGGAASWGMGWAGQHYALRRDSASPNGPMKSQQRSHARAQRWLDRWGPKACVLSWLPVVGDPLCAAAGWLKLPLAECMAYMALGKGLRYAVLVGGWGWLS